MDVLPSLKVVVNGVALDTDGKLDESYIHIITDGFFYFPPIRSKVSKSLIIVSINNVKALFGHPTSWTRVWVSSSFEKDGYWNSSGCLWLLMVSCTNPHLRIITDQHLFISAFINEELQPPAANRWSVHSIAALQVLKSVDFIGGRRFQIKNRVIFALLFVAEFPSLLYFLTIAMFYSILTILMLLVAVLAATVLPPLFRRRQTRVPPPPFPWQRKKKKKNCIHESKTLTKLVIIKRRSFIRLRLWRRLEPDFALLSSPPSAG
ncbi:hypothetical protein [Absidia glauca]|uniref:Uncharacterized protein n=1 Tax=Absidia glauca TaxID=4829 RepID=A0A168KTH2_ABSGL|nr:hypothetical protein [Absidia glauca]